MVFECTLAFGNIHLPGELIHLFTSAGSIFTNLRFLLILNTFFCFTALFDCKMELSMTISLGHVTNSKWRSIDRLQENIHFLFDYSYFMFVFFLHYFIIIL